MDQNEPVRLFVDEASSSPKKRNIKEEKKMIEISEEVVVTGRRGRNIASSTCDLISHFLRASANVIVHRFSNHATPLEFSTRTFQGLVPYQFCTNTKVRGYIDEALAEIRDQLRTNDVQKLCFAIVNELEESLLEFNVQFYQTSLFYNKRIRGGGIPKDIVKLRPLLARVVFDLQHVKIKERLEKLLKSSTTMFRIRYVSVNEDEGPKPGFEHIVPPPMKWAVLHPWSDPIENHFNQMQFYCRSRV